MKYLRLYALAFLFIWATNSANAQLTLSPGDTALHPGYIKDRNVFQKLVWMDSTGATTHTAILNLITKVDTIKHTVTYLQIRNDGKRDSSVSTYPGLEPVYLSTKGAQFMETYDYRKKGVVGIHTEKGGKVTYDGELALAAKYFESFLTDVVMTALPVETMKPLQYFFYNTNLKQLTAYEIIKINADVLLGLNGNNTPIYILTVRSGKNEFLVYMDKKTHQTLKTAFVAENGSSFVKELL